MSDPARWKSRRWRRDRTVERWRAAPRTQGLRRPAPLTAARALGLVVGHHRALSRTRLPPCEFRPAFRPEGGGTSMKLHGWPWRGRARSTFAGSDRSTCPTTSKVSGVPLATNALGTREAGRPGLRRARRHARCRATVRRRSPRADASRTGRVLLGSLPPLASWS